MNADGKQPHILCVNHSPEILALQRDILQEEGFRVTTQSRLDKDLDAVVALAPNVIIIDYMWRQSDDEWVFLTMLTMDPRTREIPIILCTGAVREARELQEHLASLGIRVVLKPFRIEHLIRVVNDAVGKTAASDGPVISTLE
jgi:CheY-like chemotaxis protein